MTLKKLGIEPNEVSLLQLGNSALRMVALQQQGIDATILTVEDGLAAKRLGLQRAPGYSPAWDRISDQRNYYDEKVCRTKRADYPSIHEVDGRRHSFL